MISLPKYSQSRRRGATVAGLFGVALASVLLFCGAGNVPVENFTPQGPMQADLNAGGHSVTNAAAINAINVAVSGALTGSGSQLTGLHGYMSETVAAASTTSLSSLGRVSEDTITLNAGAATYVVNRSLADASAQAGDIWEINISYPASTNPTVNFYDSSTSGTLLLSSVGTAVAGSTTLQFVFNGTAWVHYQKGAVLTKNLPTGPLYSTNGALSAETAAQAQQTVTGTTGSAGNFGSGIASSLERPVDGGGYFIPTEDIYGDLLYPQGGGTTYLSDNSGDLYYGSGALLADHNGNLYSPGVTSGKFLVSKGTSAMTGAVPNAANGPVVTDSNNNIPYDPHTTNLDNTYDVFEGDSITYGLGLSSGQSFPSVFSTLTYAKNHSTIINDGVSSSMLPAGSVGGQTVTGTWASGSTTITLTASPTVPLGSMSVTGAGIPYGTTGTLVSTTLTLSQKTFAAGSSASITLGGNNATDRFPSQVSPYRPWANTGSTAGTGTITGDSNVTLTFSSAQFSTSLFPTVGGTIYFSGHLALIATMPTSTTATIATTVPAGSGMVTSLAGINPSATSFTFGGNGGTRSNLHLLIGTNDIAGGSYTAAQIIANLTTYTTQARSAGFTVVLSTILSASRNNPPFGSAEVIRQTINQAIRNGTIPSDMIADSATILNNPANATYFQSDDLHPTAVGAALLAGYYNAGMTAGGFFARNNEGTFETPVQGQYFQPYPLAGVAGQAVYYMYNAGGVTVGMGLDSGYLPEIFAGNNGGISFNNYGFQPTSTVNRLAFMDPNGNFTINGNFKGLATQTSGTQTLATNSRTVWYSGSNGTLTLPATCAVGDTVTVVGSGLLTPVFTISANSGQSIYLGSGTAITSITEPAPGQSVQLTCTNANTSWTVTAPFLPVKLTATLPGTSSGVTITNAAILTTSAVTACHLATSAANAGPLYVSALSAGSVTIKSANASDNDTFVLTVQ